MTIVIKEIGPLLFLFEERCVHGCTVHRDMRQCFLSRDKALAMRVVRRLRTGLPPFAPKQTPALLMRQAG
jgi:hypothetical protein